MERASLTGAATLGWDTQPIRGDWEGRKLVNKYPKLSSLPLTSCWCSSLAKPNWKLGIQGPYWCSPHEPASGMDGDEQRGGMETDGRCPPSSLPSACILPPPSIPSAFVQEQVMPLSSFNYPNGFLNSCSLADSQNFPFGSFGYSRCVVIWSTSNYFVFLLPVVVYFTSCFYCRSWAAVKPYVVLKRLF